MTHLHARWVHSAQHAEALRARLLDLPADGLARLQSKCQMLWADSCNKRIFRAR